MSQENIEIVRKSFAAMARGDVEGLLELYDPEIQFLPLTGTRIESGGYHGHAGVRAYFAEVADVWDELRPYAVNFETTGDVVVVLGGCAVRGKGRRCTREPVYRLAAPTSAPAESRRSPRRSKMDLDTAPLKVKNGCQHAPRRSVGER